MDGPNRRPDFLRGFREGPAGQERLDNPESSLGRSKYGWASSAQHSVKRYSTTCQKVLALVEFWHWVLTSHGLGNSRPAGAIGTPMPDTRPTDATPVARLGRGFDLAAVWTTAGGEICLRSRDRAVVLNPERLLALASLLDILGQPGRMATLGSVLDVKDACDREEAQPAKQSKRVERELLGRRRPWPLTVDQTMQTAAASGARVELALQTQAGARLTHVCQVLRTDTTGVFDCIPEVPVGNGVHALSVQTSAYVHDAGEPTMLIPVVVSVSPAPAVKPALDQAMDAASESGALVTLGFGSRGTALHTCRVSACEPGIYEIRPRFQGVQHATTGFAELPDRDGMVIEVVSCRTANPRDEADDIADRRVSLRSPIDSPRGWTRSRIRALVHAMLEARANTKGWVMPTPIARADQALRDALDGLREDIAAGECEDLGVAAVAHPADPIESAEDARVQGLRDTEAARAVLLASGMECLGDGLWGCSDSTAVVHVDGGDGGEVEFNGDYTYTPAQLRALATLAEQGLPE